MMDGGSACAPLNAGKCRQLVEQIHMTFADD